MDVVKIVRHRDAGRSWQLTALENVCSCGRLFQWDDDSICGTIKRRHVCSTMVCTEKDWPLNACISRSTMSYYYYCYGSFNAPCAGHKDVESQELLWTCASRRLFYFFSRSSLTWYNTIRDAILTCARKPTWVSLIYRTEPTTKKCKNKKTKK